MAVLARLMGIGNWYIYFAVFLSLTVQLNELGSDLKDFVADATPCIDKHLETKLSEISQAMKNLILRVPPDFPHPTTRLTFRGELTPTNRWLRMLQAFEQLAFGDCVLISPSTYTSIEWSLEQCSRC